MEKILYAFLAIIISLFVSFFSTPALTCARNDGNTTGSACSIADLNSMSKYKYVKENSSAEPPSGVNLRPVKLDSSPSVGNRYGCNLGLCITEKVFKTGF